MRGNYRAPLIVAGIIFVLFALLHLMRLFAGWDVVVATFSIPFWWSIVAILIAGGLAAWMFKAARLDKHHSL